MQEAVLLIGQQKREQPRNFADVVRRSNSMRRGTEIRRMMKGGLVQLIWTICFHEIVACFLAGIRAKEPNKKVEALLNIFSSMLSA